MERFKKAFCDTVAVLLGTMAATVVIDKGIDTYRKLKEKFDKKKKDKIVEEDTETF